MDFASLIESQIAPTGASFPKLDAEGTYVVKVLESAYTKTKAGDKSQGVLKVEVVEGEKATARVNLYIGTGSNDQQAAMNVNPYYNTLLALGVSKDKIIDDCDSWSEVIANITSIMTKQLARGVEIKLNLTLKENAKKSTEEKKEFYRNVSVYTTPTASTVSVSEAPADLAKSVKAPKAPKATKIPEAMIPNDLTKVTEGDDDDNSWMDVD
jgi:hypothetical protein